MKVIRHALFVVLVTGMTVGSTVVATAQDPKPGETFTDRGFTSTAPVGYRHPPALYSVGETFSYTFTLRFDAAREGARPAPAGATGSECFTLQIFRLNGFDPEVDLTEAFLEQNITENQTLAFDSGDQSMTLKSGDAPKTLTQEAFLDFGTGYFQFDFGFCSDRPLLPKVGFAGPLNSGFIRVLAANPVAPPPAPAPPPTTQIAPAPASTLPQIPSIAGVSGSVLAPRPAAAPAPGAAPTSRTRGVTVTRLAQTGAGSQRSNADSLLPAIVGLLLIAAGWRLYRRTTP